MEDSKSTIQEDQKAITPQTPQAVMSHSHLPKPQKQPLNGIKLILSCRRTMLGILAIICLTFLGLKKGIDVSTAIMGVVAAIAGSNASEKVGISYTNNKNTIKED